eukprot:3790515-Pyramimonas_sp.AAC.1
MRATRRLEKVSNKCLPDVDSHPVAPDAFVVVDSAGLAEDGLVATFAKNISGYCFWRPSQHHLEWTAAPCICRDRSSRRPPPGRSRLLLPSCPMPMQYSPWRP